MLFYGLANAIFSFSIGFISSVIGRLPILLLGFATSLSIISLLLTETIAPKTEQISLLVTVAIVWALSDACVKTMNSALHGSLFEKNQDAAFASMRLFESIGFIIGFAYADILCNDQKLYAVLTCSITGYIGVFTVLWRHRVFEENSTIIENYTTDEKTLDL